MVDRDEIQTQIEQLQERIHDKEREIDRVSREIAALKADLEPFQARYERLVTPILTRMAAAENAISQLKDYIRRQDKRPYESLWREQAPAQDAPAPRVAVKQYHTDRLKQLYRQLARSYHPDFAEDDADRERRNRLMAMINIAYEHHDVEALEALEQATDHDNAQAPADSAQRVAIPLEVLQLRDLQHQYFERATELDDLQVQLSELKHDDLLDLQLSCSLAWADGRDLLQEIADDLEQQYWGLMAHLDRLRQEAQRNQPHP